MVATTPRIDGLSSSEYINDFVWTSVSQITLAASKIFINNILYTNVSPVVFDFANGTGDNGLDTGAEGSDRWYALYAVPKTASTFILKASLALPPELGGAGPTGIATYRYLGSFRNGNGFDQTSDILRFVKIGPHFRLLNYANYGSMEQMGMRLSATSGSPSTFPIVIGGIGFQIPFNKTTYLIHAQCNTPASTLRAYSTSSGNRRQMLSGYTQGVGGSQFPNVQGEITVDTAFVNEIVCEATSIGGGATFLDLIGWLDPYLARQGAK